MRIEDEYLGCLLSILLEPSLAAKGQESKFQKNEIHLSIDSEPHLVLAETCVGLPIYSYLQRIAIPYGNVNQKLP